MSLGCGFRQRHLALLAVDLDGIEGLARQGLARRLGTVAWGCAFAVFRRERAFLCGRDVNAVLAQMTFLPTSRALSRAASSQAIHYCDIGRSLRTACKILMNPSTQMRCGFLLTAQAMQMTRLTYSRQRFAGNATFACSTFSGGSFQVPQLSTSPCGTCRTQQTICCERQRPLPTAR